MGKFREAFQNNMKKELPSIVDAVFVISVMVPSTRLKRSLSSGSLNVDFVATIPDDAPSTNLDDISNALTGGIQVDVPGLTVQVSTTTERPPVETLAEVQADLDQALLHQQSAYEALAQANDEALLQTTTSTSVATVSASTVTSVTSTFTTATMDTVTAATNAATSTSQSSPLPSTPASNPSDGGEEEVSMAGKASSDKKHAS